MSDPWYKDGLHPMNTKQKLLSEFTNYRWFIMLELADLAEQEDEIIESRGWRWLAEEKRWPSHSNFFYFRDRWTKRTPSYHLPMFVKGTYPRPQIKGESISDALEQAAKVVGEGLGVL